MRKIENKSDWNDFVRDVEDNLNDSPWRGNKGSFGLSQEGDYIDGRFYSNPDSIGDESMILVFEDDETGKEEEPNDFYESLKGAYSLPFYIVDTGANYNWL